MPALFCARPHAKFVDFNEGRFIVARGNGLDVGSSHLEYGDEIPKGALTAIALREVYEMQPGIELLEYAWADPTLREACARRGVAYDPTPVSPKVVLPDLDKLERTELVILCEECGLPTHGSIKQLRSRLAALVV